MEKFFYNTYFQRFISVLICICFCGILWKSTEQSAVYKLNDNDKKDLQVEYYGAFNEFVDLQTFDYKKLEKQTSVIEGQNIRIAVSPKIVDGYIDDLYLFILYETEGYSNGRYGINFYEMEPYYLFNIAEVELHEIKNGELDRREIDLSEFLLYECEWRVESKTFSPVKKYLCMIQLISVDGKTIPKSKLPDILEKIKFEVNGYF